MINYEVLDDVMQFIEDHPDEHDQTTWGRITSCGTTACFAGWTLLRHSENVVYFDLFDVMHARGDDIAGHARKILGLTEGQSTALFHSTNTIDELKNIVKELHNDPNVGMFDLLKVCQYD